ncbi:hypothetical protein LINPERHAP2_LOCUS22739 [Linum perenne]
MDSTASHHVTSDLVASQFTPFIMDAMNYLLEMVQV